ncbi:hypothetical protein [Methanosphaera cuniculi]|uniref:Uncharacterized protein n=1 Tax=Methanosphaera cuniculi TaxID=1077256 RepID=A0A2A2HEA1_9EURY|nr:hypothetical protein [Methanosphaera cuniculi]PAV07650.1 hypothetical protein ASJ82_08210 [Methanosphaera cuniculi]PWL08024.1 hypothetical protein MSCUN_09550 [Methanosphaera cuniculi]
MEIKELDITKIVIIVFVGIASVLSIYLNVSDIPALCLGGLIGYLSKDIPVTDLGIDEYGK